MDLLKSIFYESFSLKEPTLCDVKKSFSTPFFLLSISFFDVCFSLFSSSSFVQVSMKMHEEMEKMKKQLEEAEKDKKKLTEQCNDKPIRPGGKYSVRRKEF